MRVRAILGGAALALIAFPLMALGADPPHRDAVLKGTSEVPAVVTNGTGTGWVTISADDTTITYHVEYSGLSGAALSSHIHFGPASCACPVILPFVIGPSPMNGTVTAADLKLVPGIATFADAVAAIKAGNTYINVHTDLNKGGEIRGQIALVPATSTEPFDSGNNMVGQLALMLGLGFLIIAAVISRRTQRRAR